MSDSSQRLQKLSLHQRRASPVMPPLPSLPPIDMTTVPVTNDTNADPSMLADDTHTRDMLDQLFDAGTRIVAGIGTETDDAIVKLIQ